MTITLQRNNSEVNAMDKDITDITTITGELRTKTDELDPTVLIDASAETINSCNYFSISEFGRSYFLDPPKWISGTLWEISGHVDALSSFANEIRANRAIIKRNANKYNLYLDNGDFRVYQKPLIKTLEFSNGFSPSNATPILLTAGGL